MLHTSKTVMNHSTTISEAQHIVRTLAEPWIPGDSVKAAVRRVTRKLKSFSTRRVETIWYAHHCALLAHEMDALRIAYRERLDERAVELSAELDRLKAEAAELERRM